MALDAQKTESVEVQAKRIASELIKRLGTVDVPFCFRTANGSVYASDRKLRTVRYKTAENVFQDASNVTVFLDHKYIDPAQTDRSSKEYLPNTPLIHSDSFLVLAEENKDPIHVKSFDAVPANIGTDELKRSLFLLVYDGKVGEVVKKAPVSIMPQEGFHPIEFCDPHTHRYHHRMHFGNQIVNIAITNRKSEEDIHTEIEKLALMSLEQKK